MIRLIAGREMSSRLQQKGFRFGALVFIGLIAAIALLPKFLGGGASTTYDVGIVASPSSSQIRQILEPAGPRPVDAPRVRVHDLASSADAQSQVRSGQLDAALDGDRVLSRSTSGVAAQLLASAAATAQLADSLSAAGLSPSQIDSALAAPSVAVVQVSSGSGDTRKAIATIAIVVLFAQLITFCSWVGMGVVEEKSSRVVELVLSTVRPWQLLAGKLLGIGLLAVGQLVAAGLAGLAVVRISGSIDLPPGTYAAVGVTFIWFVFGFAFFASMAAALCSLVSRQEEVSGVLMPVSALLMVSYGLGFAAVANGSGTLATAASMIPPVSAVSMPARAAGGDVPWWQLGVSLALLALASAAMIGLAARIYRAAVLHAGSRVSLRTAWRGEAAAALR